MGRRCCQVLVQGVSPTSLGQFANGEGPTEPLDRGACARWPVAPGGTGTGWPLTPGGSCTVRPLTSQGVSVGWPLIAGCV